MSRCYSNLDREQNPHAMPNIETFEAASAECPKCKTLVCVPDADTGICPKCLYQAPHRDDYGKTLVGGWFYWFCFPGCLPDGEPMGPFQTEAEAVAGARKGGDHE